MPSLFDIVTHTPLWVWGLLIVLVALGLQRTRDRALPLWRMLLLPVVMTGLAINALAAGAGAAFVPILVGLVSGAAIGWALERPGATRRLSDGRLWLAGEWLSLVQILAVFVVRYARASVAVAAPALAAAPAWQNGTAFLSALLAALFVARTAARLCVYFTALPVAA